MSEELRSILDNVYIDGSYIIDLTYEKHILILNLDLALLPSHALYTQPVIGEAYCYRKASVYFEDVFAFHSINWKYDMYKNADETADMGNLYCLAMNFDKKYLLKGSFGELSFFAERHSINIGFS